MKIMTLLFGVSLIFLLDFYGNKDVSYTVLRYKAYFKKTCLNVNFFFK